MPSSAARSADRNGSNPTTFMSNPWARFATARPDPAQADDPQRLAAELRAGELVAVPLAGLEAVVGLGDVPREGEHQGHRVLGRRDGVAARRVHHHDPLAGRGRDVDVVDAHAGADDHLEPGLVAEHLGRQLRPRADHDPVGLGQRRRAGRRVSSLVETTTSSPGSARSSSKPFVGQLVGHQHAMRPRSRLLSDRCHAIRENASPNRDPSCTVGSARSTGCGHGCFWPRKTCCAAVTADAGLDVQPRSLRTISSAARPAIDVELVGVAHVADADDLALELVLAADGRDAEPLDEPVADVGVLQALGDAEGGQALGRAGAEELEARAPGCRPGRPRSSRLCRCQTFSIPSALIRLRRRAEGQDQGVGRACTACRTPSSSCGPAFRLK